MGSSGLGAAQQTVDKAIRAIRPHAVIAVGIAFGMNETKQSIGDILLSQQLRLYDLQRVGTKIILRGDRPHASPRLINYFVSAAQMTWKGQRVRPGVILTGDKLIDDLDYRNELHALEEEAIGGEMEGAGVYVASHDHRVDWIVLKAICDWADGHKDENKEVLQKKAAANAAEFLAHALQQVPLVALPDHARSKPHEAVSKAAHPEAVDVGPRVRSAGPKATFLPNALLPLFLLLAALGIICAYLPGTTAPSSSASRGPRNQRAITDEEPDTARPAMPEVTITTDPDVYAFHRRIPLGAEFVISLRGIPSDAIITWSKPTCGILNSTHGNDILYTARTIGSESIVATIKSRYTAINKSLEFIVDEPFRVRREPDQ